MKQESLANKYRPDTFEGYIGQERAVSMLQNHIERKRLSNAYLIYGPSGSGKTTLARILANTVNGSLDNYTEKNSVSEGSIEEIRRLIELARLMPQNKEPMRFICLDEAHALSKNVKSALLKPLEEPHPNVVWIMCTTRPEAFPADLKQRFTMVPLSVVSEDLVYKFVRRIAKAEGFDVSKEDLMKCAKSGLPRIALYLLDKVASGKSIEDQEYPLKDMAEKLLKYACLHESKRLKTTYARLVESPVPYGFQAELVETIVAYGRDLIKEKAEFTGAENLALVHVYLSTLPHYYNLVQNPWMYASFEAGLLSWLLDARNKAFGVGEFI